MSRRYSKGRPARSEPKVVGFVCEGSTDLVVLRRMVEEVFGEIDALPLQPNLDELDRQVPGTKSGWSEVRAWCEREGSLEEYFTPDIGDGLDLLVIALDLDIAVKAGVQKSPDNLEAYDAKALCDVIKSWLPSPLPGRVVIAIPVMSTEAWVLAALFPRMDKLESEPDPARILAAKKRIAMGKTGPWKRSQDYRKFAEAVVRKIKHVREACPEAGRFMAKLENMRAVPGTDRE